MLSRYTPSRSLRSFGTELLTVPKARTKSHGEAAFIFYAPSLGNTLAEYLRVAETVETFKRALKTYLFNLAYHSVICICLQGSVVALLYTCACLVIYSFTYMTWFFNPMENLCLLQVFIPNHFPSVRRIVLPPGLKCAVQIKFDLILGRRGVVGNCGQCAFKAPRVLGLQT